MWRTRLVEILHRASSGLLTRCILSLLEFYMTLGKRYVDLKNTIETSLMFGITLILLHTRGPHTARILHHVFER